ncbi:ATP-binding protein [Natronomonas sp. LN261]|uniref:ATP-binding protein n=1 Tax=Natronomonas sp. LN261 TaxID=2750669 RepID=UPI0015EED2C8|nr:ATP-binding protein [Natronomonas sp. LN261]
MSTDNTTQKVLDAFQAEARDDTEITIEINGNILREVSSQLYDNPRRAIEELVCNSYDAYATECYVSTPNDEDDVLQVLDNGKSMDEDELGDMWEVAGGPKQKLAEKGVEREIEGRKQIGRFGVGKLAAFAIGSELTHVATVDGTTRIISVSQGAIRNQSFTDPPTTKIWEVEEDRARELLGSYLDGIPDPWEKDWESWTLAVVDDVDEENTGRRLKPEHLNRMIRTAIPLEADFEVARNGDKIQPRNLTESVDVKLDISQDEEYQTKLKKELQKFWSEYREDIDDEDDVPDRLLNLDPVYDDSHYAVDSEELEDSNGTPEPNALKIPKLGVVHGEAAIYSETLTPRKLASRDIYDHGHKVRVRGKLLNRTDPLFGTSPKSHKFWNRFRSEFEMPVLDDDLLVQRDTLQDGVHKEVSKKVLDSVFNILRTRADEEEETDPGRFGHHLHTLSPGKAGEALAGLTGEDAEFPEGGWDDVDVELAEFEKTDSAVEYDDSDHAIYINDNHPLFTALEERNAPTKLRKVVGEALAGNEIAFGYLTFSGVRKDLIQDGKDISETALEIASRYIEDPFDYHKEQVKKMSHETDDPFEESIVDALNELGVTTDHMGGSGDSDAVAKFATPDNEEDIVISIEAKGAEEGSVSHSEANIATIREHMQQDECNHALLVAREFTKRGTEKNEDGEYVDSKLINQLGMYEDVSAINIEAFQHLLETHRDTPLDHRQLQKILTNQKHPEELVGFIDECAQAMPAEPEVMYRVLEVAWEIQKQDDRSQRIGLIMGEVDIDDNHVISILDAAQVSTGMVVLRENESKFSIFQTPNQVMRAMGANRS